MPGDWTTSTSLDLHVDLDRSDRRASLEAALRDSVRAGRLAPGTRLPSSRALAADLGLARGTVSQAYDQLVAEGYLTARQGSGTRVADVQTSAAPPAPAAEPTSRTERWDLRPGHPDVGAFPRAAWLAATKRVMAEAPHSAFGYGDPRGTRELREALAAYLGRVRGVVAPPERIVVCSGYSHALSLLAGVLAAGHARALAFEDPSLGFHREIVARAGLATPGVPVDHQGVVVDLISAPHVVVTPAHQYPLGVTMHADRRADLVGWARRVNGLIIEDDYDGEFRYDRQPVGAVQGLAPGRVAYAGTASKSLAPGLRLGWLALPPELVDPVVASKQHADRYPSVIDQLVLVELLVTGAYDRQVRQCRLRYRKRRDRLVAKLAERAPSVRVTGIAAGLHAVAELPNGGATEPDVMAMAARRSLALTGLGSMWVRPDPPLQGLVVGYGTPAAHAFEPALEALATVLSLI